ncbi:MAG: outer membrane lipoprotein-sorting protein [Candidatus Wallbacteria bacterium]|nr:outer membrane lipoprotein-sorting protein [Candidatus Wallbacteria bacterium]
MTKSRQALVAALGAALAVLGTAASAQQPAQPDADAIARQSLEAFYYPGKDFRALIEMKLVTRNGETRERSLTMLRKNGGGPGGPQRYLLYFHKPEDVRRMAFLVWKYPERDDDRWLFLPAIDLVKRIAASDRRSSFVGSDFTYEDISGRDLAADTRKLLREEKLAGIPCHLLECAPREEAEYGRKLSWIDRKSFLPRREEYYDRRGELYKLFSADTVEDIKGVPTITRRTMKDVRTGHTTTVELTAVEYGLGLDDETFTERFLRRPPQRWMR